MTASLVYLPLLQFLDATGVALPGAKLYSYLAGGSTPAALYADAAMATPLSNPAVADSQGKLLAYMPLGTAYKLDLFDQFDVHQAGWPVDGVSQGSTTLDLAGYSATVSQMRLTHDPGEVGSESLATTMAGELERLRLSAYETKHTLDPRLTYWYESIVPAHLPLIDVRLYGAAGDGVTDDTTALTTALAQTGSAGILIPAGTFKLTATLTVPENKLVLGLGVSSIVKKFFNGALVNLQSFASLERLKLDGNGATYTGVGIAIDSGLLSQLKGRQVVQRCTIYDTESYNIEYTGAGVGYGSTIIDCDLRVHNDTKPSIKFPLDSTTTGNRHLLNCRNIASDLLDFGGAQNGTVIGCLAGSVNAQGSIIFSQVECHKGIFVGNRFANGGTTLTVKGADHVFSGNMIAGPVVFETESGDCRFDSTNVTVGLARDPTDTNKNNWIDQTIRDWLPNWFGADSNPVVGNGVLVGRYTTINRRRWVDLALVCGSTTTFGVGLWTFGLPGQASTDDATPYGGNAVTYVGTAFLNDADGNHYVAAAYVLPGDTAIYLVSHGAATGVSATVPFTWAAGDTLYLSFSYDM